MRHGTAPAPRRWLRIAAEVVFALAAVAAMLAAGYSAGWSAGTRAANEVASRSDGYAAAAANEADMAAASAAAAEAAVKAGTPGLCWQARRGVIVGVAPPEAVPGGYTCPSGPWRFTPALPQPGQIHTSPS